MQFIHSLTHSFSFQRLQTLLKVPCLQTYAGGVERGAGSPTETEGGDKHLVTGALSCGFQALKSTFL